MTRYKPMVVLGLVAVVVGTFVWFRQLPYHSQAAPAQSNPLDSYVLYGISSQNNSLVKYLFENSALSTVGAIHNADDALYTGIEAAAYIPGSSNIYGFWKDPSDGLSKLLYISMSTGQSTPVGASLGNGVITAATAAMPSPSIQIYGDNDPTPTSDAVQYEVYAVQQTSQVGFNITSDQVVPTESFTVRVTAIGAAISYGGSYDMPVAFKVKVGNDTVEPFGSFSQPVNANINDDADDEVQNQQVDNPRSHVLPNTYTSGTSVSIIGQTWTRISGRTGASNTDWNSYRIVDSTSASNQARIYTLRNGDAVPNVSGFLNQASLKVYIGPYIDSATNKIKLAINQALYCFEMGSSLTGASADFQDLVVLVTLAKNTSDLNNPSYPTVAKLVKINHKTGQSTTVMPLTRLYDGLAAASAQLFYATQGNQLYTLNPSTGAETLLGSSGTNDDFKALEFAGANLYRFSSANNTLQTVNTFNGQSIGSDVSVGNAQSLRTMIFMRLADEPAPLIGYD